MRMGELLLLLLWVPLVFFKTYTMQDEPIPAPAAACNLLALFLSSAAAAAAAVSFF